MKKKHLLAIVIISTVVAACSSAQYTYVPPAVDLGSLGSLGLVLFKADNVKGDLGDVTTQYFLQEVTAAQRVPIVELGPPDTVLADIGKTAFDRDAIIALGQKQGLEAVFIGEVKVTKVKPQVDLLAPLSKSLFARATMDISVTARLVSTKNGATVWTESVTREGTVGSIGMSGGVPVFSVRDKDEATSDLLRDIMYNMTWDFRPTRQRL